MWLIGENKREFELRINKLRLNVVKIKGKSGLIENFIMRIGDK